MLGIQLALGQLGRRRQDFSRLCLDLGITRTGARLAAGAIFDALRQRLLRLLQLLELRRVVGIRRLFTLLERLGLVPFLARQLLLGRLRGGLTLPSLLEVRPRSCDDPLGPE